MRITLYVCCEILIRTDIQTVISNILDKYDIKVMKTSIFTDFTVYRHTLTV